MNNKFPKRYFLFPILLIICAFEAVLYFHNYTAETSNTNNNGNDLSLRSLVLYEGDKLDYYDEYLALAEGQTLLNNVTYENTEKSRIKDYDIVFANKSIIGNDKIKKELIDYVNNGGYLFLTNEFLTWFDPSFFGGEEVLPVVEYPNHLVYDETNDDKRVFSEFIYDYDIVFKNYWDFDKYKKYSFGSGIKNTTGTSLAKTDNNLSLFGINNVGKGCVMYTSEIIPEYLNISGFTMDLRDETQDYYINSCAAANSMLRTMFVEYVQKQKFGFSAKRIFGTNGSNSAAWQLHYEEKTGIENDSLKKFSELSVENDLIPSFTLVRNTYKWFSRYESINYILSYNNDFNIDFNQGAYSSGAHLIEDSNYFSLSEIDNAGSYFIDYPEYNYRAYPCIKENGDIICGSEDGYFYLLENVTTDNEYATKAKTKLVDQNGEPIKVKGFSSPTLLDCNGDGVEDILSGSVDGKLYQFISNSDGSYQNAKVYYSGRGACSMPFAKDIDNDGQAEIAVGTNDGAYILKNDQEISIDIVGFSSPVFYDIDNDHDDELLFGTFDGYIKIYKNNGQNFIESGYLDSSEKNFKGNNHLKFGNYCVPRFYDINKDGENDLVVGLLEYGLSMPIDSPYFKLRDKLQGQIDYAKENNFYVGVHFYTNSYASSEREQEELKLQKQAFSTYGLSFDNVGCNQHTWHESRLSKKQTFESAKNSGILWDSGFQPAFSPCVPQASAENTFAIPFFYNYTDKDFLVFNASTLLYAKNDLTSLTSKYDLPVSVYNHCDFVYSNPQAELDKIHSVADFVKNEDYNFIREDQLVKSFAAAINNELSAKKNDKTGIITFEAVPKSRDFPLYDENYSKSVGVKITFSENTDLSKVAFAAANYKISDDKRSVYMGLSDGGMLSLDYQPQYGSMTSISDEIEHIERISVPCHIVESNGEFNIDFLDSGFLQVVVLGKVENVSDGFKIHYENGRTYISRFGNSTKLNFKFVEE